MDLSIRDMLRRRLLRGEPAQMKTRRLGFRMMYWWTDRNSKAGTYGLSLDVEKEGPWKWIFSNNATSWGSYYYDPKEDALRVETKAEDAAYTEYLTYSFDERRTEIRDRISAVGE